MKTKRIICTVCALSVLLCSLASCSQGNETNNDSSQTQSSSLEEANDESHNQTDESAAADSDDSSQADEESVHLQAAPAMWKITSDEGTTITLLGSIHILDSAYYPLPQEITDAYESSDIIAVECDTTQSSSITYQAALMNEMLYTDGDTLSSHISDEALAAIDSYMQSYGMTASTLESYKPWAASSTLDSLSLLYSGLTTDSGIESYFLSLAYEDSKEIYEVESVEFQLDLLMNLSDETYDFLFRCYEGETKESQLEALDEMVELWAQGDIDGIGELNEGDITDISQEDLTLYNDYMNQMVYDRNVTMANAVEELLAGDKDVFYFVGAAHFAGEKGIISLLENDGYTLERVEYQ